MCCSVPMTSRGRRGLHSMPSDGIAHLLGNRVDELTARAVSDGQVPGVVAAVAHGEDVHVSVAGAMSVDGPAIRRDTVFRIASISKPITAVCALTLIEAGLLAIDEPVDRTLPELADRRVLRAPDAALTDTVPARRAVTVRDLLTSTWGFGMQGAMFEAAEPWPVYTATLERRLHTFGPPEPDDTPDPDTWIALLGELPLLAQPGERWLYQTSVQVLGVLIARAAGAPLPQVLHDRVLSPLGMADTGFHATDVSRLATQYQRRDGELAVLDPPDGQWSRPPLFPDASGGLVSTVDDLVRFGRMLLRGGEGIVRPQTVADMTRDQLTNEQRTAVWPGFSFLDGCGWGYGVAVHDDGRYTWDGGFGTAWSNLPDHDLTVVTLTQRFHDEHGAPPICDDVLNAVRRQIRT
jgi:CubicO group peptidase (beta-lactamase class C family)